VAATSPLGGSGILVVDIFSKVGNQNGYYIKCGQLDFPYSYFKLPMFLLYLINFAVKKRGGGILGSLKV